MLTARAAAASSIIKRVTPSHSCYSPTTISYETTIVLVPHYPSRTLRKWRRTSAISSSKTSCTLDGRVRVIGFYLKGSRNRSSGPSVHCPATRRCNVCYAISLSRGVLAGNRRHRIFSPMAQQRNLRSPRATRTWTWISVSREKLNT